MPNLTPLEIQKQIFARKLKGFDPDEVRAYLHMVAEEIEILIRDVDRLSRENLMLREDLDDHNQRERILKDTLLSERLVSQAMSRVADLEKTIQDLKVERRSARNKLQAAIDTVQHLLMLDAEQEANELPITSMYRAKSE